MPHVLATGGKPEKEASLDEASIQAMSHWQRHVERHRSEFETFARQSGFSISFSDEGGTCFNHDRRTVVLDIPQMVELSGGSEKLFNYIVMHELGHLKELSDDPQGYERLISDVSTDGARGKIIFKLYNCLMDIYVNTNTANRAPIFSAPYGKGIFDESVRSLYRDQSFKDRDLQSNPLCIQYAYALLNQGMEVGEDLVVSPEVAEALAAPLKLAGGAEVSHQELIDQYLRPVIGSSSAPGAWRATIGQRKTLIDRTIRPIFEKLMAIDSERGETFEGMAEVHGEKTDLAKDLLREIKRMVKEANATPKERAEAALKKSATAEAEAAKLSPEEAKNFAETYQKAYPAMLELAELWRSIRDKRFVSEMVRQGYFNTGSDVDINEVIRKFPQIRLNPGRPVDIMTRQIPEERVILEPKRIWVIVSVDCSGSMADCVEQTQQTVVAVAGSIAIINKEEGDRNEILEGQLSVVGFEETSHTFLHSKDTTTIRQIAAVYKDIHAGGGTSDHTALQTVCGWIESDPELQGKIVSGEILPVLIEITDGDTSDQNQTKREIARLARLGVRSAAIRFGGLVRPDSIEEMKRLARGELSREKQRELEEAMRGKEATTFGEIWGPAGYRVWGVGEVRGAMTLALRDLISQAEE